MNKSPNKLNITQKEELTLNTLVGDSEENNLASSNENVNKILLQRIEKTPFDLYSEDGKIAIKIGKWTCTEVMENTEENKEKLLDLVRRRDWNLIMSAIGALIEIRTEYKELTKD